MCASQRTGGAGYTYEMAQFIFFCVLSTSMNFTLAQLRLNRIRGFSFLWLSSVCAHAMNLRVRVHPSIN